MKDTKSFISYTLTKYSPEEMLQRSEWLYNLLNQRRSVRIFSDDPVPKKVIENIILTAGTAPSGAHKQPWHFCVVSDPDIKAQIRVAAEKEEYENYTRRMSHRWLEDLKPFGTDHLKPFLEIAPYLIVVMKKPYEVDSEGKKINNYYVNESVGLATGMLLAAIHNAGLISLTHTPSPMRFLRKILKRPENETPFLLIPVGQPHKKMTVPNLRRKPLEKISDFYV
ncbi:MAG TPA: nitroreductase family protein [Flavobacteriales bacterium]|jgi:iodotyrosine deiodinase|nr:nitroreductase family protein [Flavobacteriales bacterium]